MVLGCMTDELEKDFGVNSYIKEFVSGGPKHYSFKVHCGKDQSERIITKVKGFKLSFNTAAQINFERLRDNVHAFVQDHNRNETNVLIQRIERTQDRKVITVIRKKVYRITYTKRVIKPDFSTVPYGYIL